MVQIMSTLGVLLFAFWAKEVLHPYICKQTSLPFDFALMNSVTYDIVTWERCVCKWRTHMAARVLSNCQDMSPTLSF